MFFKNRKIDKQVEDEETGFEEEFDEIVGSLLVEDAFNKCSRARRRWRKLLEEKRRRRQARRTNSYLTGDERDIRLSRLIDRAKQEIKHTVETLYPGTYRVDVIVSKECD